MPSGLFKFAVSTVFAAAASAFAHPGMPAGHPEVAHPNRTLFDEESFGVRITEIIKEQ